MQVTLAGTLLRIQWQPYTPDIEAEVVRRLESIYSAIKGNMPRTWYVHLDRLEDVMEQFPGAQYAPEVWAAYPAKAPLGRMETPDYVRVGRRRALGQGGRRTQRQLRPACG